MSTLERAIEIAAQAHAGQVDEAGEPRILHPIRVMLRITHPQARIAAVLHEVLEGQTVTAGQLAQAGFAPEVIAAVEVTARQPGESLLEAAGRAIEDPIALEVTLADNADNLDISRIAQPTAQDLQRIQDYQDVRAFLLGTSF